MRPVVKLYKLGRLSYQRALDAQLALFNNIKQDVTRSYEYASSYSSKNEQLLNSSSKIQAKTNSLILVEHEPVYTVGIRKQQYDAKYIADLKQTLARHQLRADFFETNRGGLITFHGPGQFVAYPIINLNDFNATIVNRSVKAYVRLLENVIIDTLAAVGIPGAHTVKEYPGVWLDDGERKIAFVGISCKRFITMHGLSINCNCDLSWFDHIISCGIEHKIITSIQQEFLSTHRLDSPKSKKESRISPEVHHIANHFCKSFKDHFECDLHEEVFPWNIVIDC